MFSAMPEGDAWDERRAGLDPRERRLYREILLGFAGGSPPARGALAASADELELDLAATLARLQALDLVQTDAATGEVAVAYPFSRRPTAHRLELPGGRQAYAMCAVDALGVAAMLASPVVVRSRDPVSGDDIVVEVPPEGEARWSPSETVVFLGARRGEQSSAELCCPVVNFFASRETATRYVGSDPGLAGAVVGVPEALARGRAIFGAALR
jgi:hypothetical protein